MEAIVLFSPVMCVVARECARLLTNVESSGFLFLQSLLHPFVSNQAKGERGYFS